MEREEFIRYNQRLFARVAPFYGLLDLLVSRVRGKLVDFVDPPAGARVLDAATGTGRQALAFAARGCRVRGVDLSLDMLAAARANARGARLPLQLADASRLPFPDEAFDVAAMSFALHCMPAAVREQAVRELIRVTRPGGSVVFVDYGLPQSRLGRQIVTGFIGLYETDLYRQFIRIDFEGFLARAGIPVARRRSFCLGAMRMLLCPRP